MGTPKEGIVNGHPKREPGLLVGMSTGLVIELLRVRIPAGSAGEISSSELFFVL